MFLNCLVLLFFINFIDADYVYRQSRLSSGRCPMPNNDNIITRMFSRGKFVKFSCRRGYTMMGNKYATCRNGEWDVPLPICIKSGCEPLEEVRNAVTQKYHNDAWVLFFCLPRHNLVGSPVVYCDGNQWNSTVPKCTDSSAQSKTSCNFEQDLCDWKQDEMHDFDWRRINTKTPSSFMNTGPPYDHTLGKNGNGYYMYIESTSRFENDTARLISPVYDEGLANNGCFVFYYHMYGRHIGGLRVYQKPDKLNMQDLLILSKTSKNRYLLFEKWGNQGDFWYTSVSSLLDVNDDFQIVIEGIRGNGFISDIAIDDVALLQGENCTNLSLVTPSPPTVYSSDSCVGRCGEESAPGLCGCDTISCFGNYSCCPDYLEVCVFDNSTDDYTSQTPELPQTQKLIATPTPNATSKTTTIKLSTTTPRSTTTTQSTSTTTQTTSTTTPRTTQITSTKIRRKTTESTTTSTTKRYVPTTQRSTQKTTSRKPTTARWTTRPTTRRTKPPTTKLTTTTTTPIPTVATTKIAPKIRTTAKMIWFTATVKSPGRYTPPSQNQMISKPRGSNGATTAVIVLLVLGACCGILYGGYYSRTSRGREALARLRGRSTRDSEVRFLKSDVDDIDDE